MSPDDRKMLEELRKRGDPVSLRVAERFETYFRMDCEAAEYVESVICMRTGFSGDPPYVGWKGLGLALNEALDERHRLRSELAAANERAKAGWMAGRDAAARIADHPESHYASDVAADIRALVPPSDPGSAGGAT